MEITITKLNNKSTKTTMDQHESKQLIQQLQEQNRSLQEHKQEQTEQINHLNVEMKSLKESVNSLELNKHDLHKTTQQISMVISLMNHRQRGNKTITGTNTCSTVTTTNASPITNAFRSPPARVTHPTDNQRQILRSWQEINDESPSDSDSNKSRSSNHDEHEGQ